MQSDKRQQPLTATEAAHRLARDHERDRLLRQHYAADRGPVAAVAPKETAEAAARPSIAGFRGSAAWNGALRAPLHEPQPGKAALAALTPRAEGILMGTIYGVGLGIVLTLTGQALLRWAGAL